MLFLKQTKQTRFSAAWRGALAFVAAGLAPAWSTAAPPVFPELSYPKPPDKTSGRTDDVEKIAASLNRPCKVRDAAAWTSATPREDLQKLSSAMMHAAGALETVTEKTDYAGRPSGGGQRLYLAQSRTDHTPLTFLWIAGTSDVSVQICGDRKPVPAGRLKCARVPPGTTVPLENCPPPTVDM